MGGDCSKGSRGGTVDHRVIKNSLNQIRTKARTTQKDLALENEAIDDDIVSWDEDAATLPQRQCSCHEKRLALANLVNNPKFSDVQFRLSKRQMISCEEKGLDEDDDDVEIVYAIRDILSASSPVFKAMLTGHMAEAQDDTTIIDIADCTSTGFITMLEFIYTNNTDILDKENLMATMYCAQKYQIDSLLVAASQYIKEKLSIKNICKFLGEGDVWLSAAFMKFVSVHAEEILRSGDFLNLSKPKIINIIQSDLLSVSDELQVFNAVLEWGNHQLQKHDIELSPDSLRAEIGDIMCYVRFPLMNSDQVLGVVNDTGLLTPDEIYSIIMFWQKMGDFETKFPSKPRKMRYIHLKYERDFDENGVIYWIGSKGGTQAFANPANSGDTTNAMSTTEMGNASTLTSRQTVQNYTSAVQNSSMTIDLGTDRLLSPDHYTIRHGFASANYYPRNWIFEGSEDGTHWDELRRHNNDTVINAPYGTSSWEIDLGAVNSGQAGEQKYSKFRIKNTGMDSSNSNYLMIAGIEIYGKLYTRERHGTQFNRLTKQFAEANLLPRDGFARKHF